METGKVSITREKSKVSITREKGMVEKEKGTFIPHHEAMMRNSTLQNEGRSIHQEEMRNRCPWTFLHQEGDEVRSPKKMKTFLHQEGDEVRSPTLFQSRW